MNFAWFVWEVGGRIVAVHPVLQIVVAMRRLGHVRVSGTGRAMRVGEGAVVPGVAFTRGQADTVSHRVLGGWRGMGRGRGRRAYPVVGAAEVHAATVDRNPRGQHAPLHGSTSCPQDGHLPSRRPISRSTIMRTHALNVITVPLREAPRHTRHIHREPDRNWFHDATRPSFQRMIGLAVSWDISMCPIGCLPSLSQHTPYRMQVTCKARDLA